MTASAGQMITGLAAAGEVALLVFAGITLGLRCGLRFAEATTYGAVGTMMALSFLFQSALLTSLPLVEYLFEALLVAAAAIYLVMSAGRGAPGLFRSVGHTMARNPIAMTGGFLVVAWLGWRALAFPAGFNPDAPSWPVLDLDAAGGLAAAGPFLNHRILPNLLLRYQTGFGLGLFGYLSYGAIGTGTYALSRRYAWPETALTVSLIVMSAPRLVLQAATPGLELMPAAAAVFALVALYRTVERPSAADFILLCLGIAFAVSDNPMGITYPLILLGLSGVVLFRRHGSRIWWRMLADQPALALAALVPLCVFSQVYQATAVASVHPAYAQNPDGIVGGAANLVRYLLESVHLTSAADSLCFRVFGVSPAGLIDRFYAAVIFPITGARGAASPFAVTWHKGPAGAWFGPLWFFLVLPAWLTAMVRGPRRLKAVAVSLAAFVYLASLIPAWIPGNAGIFTIFFSCAGFTAAYLLSPWHFSRTRRRIVQTFCLTLMLYACAHLAFGAF